MALGRARLQQVERHPVPGRDLDGAVPAGGTLGAFDTALYLGSNPLLGDRHFDGYLDEVRISSVARSPAWLTVTHRAATDSLLAYGAREPAP